MAVTSANGATIALAEAVAGSEKEFVKLMNEKSKKIKLNDTSFVNSTGLKNHDLLNYHSSGSINDYNKMSAKDLAKLNRYNIDQYPDHFNMNKINKFKVLENEYE